MEVEKDLVMYHSNYISKGVITKDGSHSCSHRDLWVLYLIKHTCKEEEKR